MPVFKYFFAFLKFPAFGLLLVATLAAFPAFAQEFVISGAVLYKQSPVKDAVVFIEGTSFYTKPIPDGRYRFILYQNGTYKLTATAPGFKTLSHTVTLTNQNRTVDFLMEVWEEQLEEVKVNAIQEKSGSGHLNSVEGTAIYEAKKSEVVYMSQMNANLATNNSRQIFAKVAGLNIWESDNAGLQLGIGGRGLSPNRTSNFNTRQNSYDISADALGYPESYYSPPAEALDRIEVVRGAASLQYGTQFGGMLNFKLKQGPEKKAIELTSRQTAGSFGLFNSFNSLGGTKGKLNYYTFYQYKRGDGWRPNSGFNVHTAFANLNYKFTEKFSLGFDYTFMHYDAQQPGGLTDAAFNTDPRQSVRERNWFRVKWNLAALTADYKFNERTRLNSRTFGLLAERDALGFMGKINRPDPMQERTLLIDYFNNIGNETRLIHRYNLGETLNTILVGTRYYHGKTDQKQGNGNATDQPDFYYLHPESLEKSDYDYLSQNFAAFAENIFNISSRFSLTPGIRYEYINTAAKGYYREEYRDLAGNILLSRNVPEDRNNSRDFVILGMGASFKPTENLETYANFSQNYRAINFNDMRIDNPNLGVDPNLKDETGYSADLGFRGNVKQVFQFDATLFYLAYDNRIGLLRRANREPEQLRTNIGRSRNVGLETFGEVELLQLFSKRERKTSLALFSNLTVLDARYTESEEAAYRNKKVELAPELMLKTGLTFRRNGFRSTLQYAYTGTQFTDATNTIQTADAVIGQIPAYYVMDLSGSYTYKVFSLEAGLNNLTNNYYFTRRASGYPGPGIIPSDGRNFYLTLQLKL